MIHNIFIDTASIEDVAKWKQRLDLSGITTNQKIFSTQKNVDFKKTVLSLCKLLNGPVSVELTTHDSISSMVTEAKKYASWHKNVVVKVPMTTDGMGLEVIRKLKKLNIKTNATVMVSLEQMMLAINAGATYASFFFNRAKDAGYDAPAILTNCRKFIDNGNFRTFIITGSIRKTTDVGDAFSSGSDIVTIPPAILDAILVEQKTQQTIEEFDSAWQQFLKK